VFALNLAEKKIEPEVVENMRTWPHSGFSVDKSVNLPAGDRAGIERLVGYRTRCSFTLLRLVPVPTSRRRDRWPQGRGSACERDTGKRRDTWAATGRTCRIAARQLSLSAPRVRVATQAPNFRPRSCHRGAARAVVGSPCRIVAKRLTLTGDCVAGRLP
jgi:hypothetical protein